MKKQLLAVTMLFTLHTAIAQTPDAKTIDKTLTITGGGTFFKPKMMAKMEKLALAQTSIYFKLATTREVLEHERGAFGRRKTDGGSVAGRLTAYLETTDGDLAESDFQEIADHYYTYLTKKLNDNGVITVDWGKIAETEFYKNGSDLEDIRKDLTYMKNKGQIYTVVNANQGKTMYKYNILGNINIGFAMGKIKKASKFSEEVGAPVLFSHLTVDFADIKLDGDVRTGTKNESNMFYTSVTKTKKWKMDAEVGAQVKVTANGGPSMFWNEKSAAETINVTTDITSDMPFASSVAADENLVKLRNRDNWFAKDFNMTPFAITTTKEKYKAAAKKALENYADMLVAKIQLSKK